MKATEIQDVIPFRNRNDLIKTFLYMKVYEKELALSDNNLSILSLFASNEDKDSVIVESLAKKYARTKQSAENAVTKLVNLGLLLKIGKKMRKVNPDILQPTDGDIIVCKLTLYNGIG